MRLAARRSTSAGSIFALATPVFHGRLGHRPSYRRRYPFIKRIGNIIFPQLFLFDQIRNRVYSSQFHRIVNAAGAHINRAAENAREYADIVYWFGASERPVPTTLTPAALASS